MPEVSGDLAGEFVLGALEADELVAVERRMRDEPDLSTRCRRVVSPIGAVVGAGLSEDATGVRVVSDPASCWRRTLSGAPPI